MAATGLVERWLARAERVDTLLEGLATNLSGQERARAQHLFYGVVRWASRLEAAQAGLMAHPPRTKVKAVLMIAGFELLEGGPALTAKVIHHAVEQAKSVASPKEARLVNAVARKIADRLVAAPTDLATEFAHPEWLVARWTRQLGAETTRKLLAWNQQPAPVYARWRIEAPVPAFLAPTKWAGFYEVKAGHWEDIRRLANEGAIYLQDPSTRLCIDLLAPQAGEVILDACAAPGGKSLFMADTMKTGKIVALDEPVAPGKSDIRLVRLKENLARAPAGVEVALIQADLTKVNTVFYRNLNLPESYDAVLLDAPCSNTGVMRHRIDVKWRLQDGDFARHGQTQLELLHAAARLVHPGGRLVYSTCSIDADENESVIKAFFDSRAGGPFKLEKQVLATPWADGHDGAGAFLLVKNG
ncbi:RsmB/NOP family class I SAM-dependent RNA methyltransferase [Lacunisphaera limnophila]|uniref:RsmB/NOP family class I SAM-dependent RNA methyltransferase n=1 Tax=Lacunisphaera limnophila TaxID=1838286 RepID=UPI0008599BE4|nr:transcription antitermination factor NusB [Lacunisphaera limnophila]